MTRVFVAVCDCRRQSVLVVADLSVGAVKHSGVFGCDWDSLEEESVRHGAWLCVLVILWRTGGMWAVKEEPDEPPSSSATLHLLLSLLLHSFALLLSLPLLLLSFLSSISHQGFISCDLLEPIISPLPASSPRPAAQHQHTATRSKPQEGQPLD